MPTVRTIYNAEDRGHAAQAVKTFAELYGAKVPQAGAKITDYQVERFEMIAA
ncbi:hypothetical protein [Streptomyces sp. CA-251247]|uniref:hypothetical protein n=1 Tax=Streptomyces sp. CA-251247 TaxID=3240062 RepID=UPI003D8EC6BD